MHRRPRDEKPSEKCSSPDLRPATYSTSLTCIYIRIVLTFPCIHSNVRIHTGYLGNRSWLGFTAHEPRLHFSIRRLGCGIRNTTINRLRKQCHCCPIISSAFTKRERANYKCNSKFPALNSFFLLNPWYVWFFSFFLLFLEAGLFFLQYELPIAVVPTGPSVTLTQEWRLFKWSLDARVIY